MTDPSSLNPLAIVVSAFVSMVLGAAWYSPLMFGAAWLSALGKSPEELGSPTAGMIGSALSCLVSAAAVDFVVAGVGVSSALGGAGIGFLLGVGIVAMTMLSDSLFSGWGWRLYLIQVGYRATYLVSMGAISGAWPR